MSTKPAERLDEFPLDEIVCGCASMTLGQLYEAMGDDPNLPFDEWLARTVALVLEGHFVSVDTEWDFALVEFILKRQSEHDKRSAGMRSSSVTGRCS